MRPWLAGLSRCWTLAILLAPVGGIDRARAEVKPWGLAIELTTRQEAAAAAGAVARSGPHDGRLNASFDPRHLRYEQDGQATLIDFPAQKRYRIDGQARTFTEQPLIAELARRELIYRQRISQGALLLDDDPNKPPPFELSEHELSVADEVSDATIDRAERDGIVSYTWQGRPLLTHSQTLVEACPDEVAQYIQLVRDVRGGHPQILARLHGLAGLPRTLTLIQPLGRGTRTTTFRVIERRSPGVEDFRLEGLTRARPAASDWLTRLAQQVESSPREAIAASARRITTAAVEARAAGKPLETALALLEYNLQVGPGDPPADPPFDRDSLAADPDVKALLGALNPSSEAGSRENSATLKRLRGRASSAAGRAVIQAFEARNRSVIGERAEAERLYQDALTAQPLLTAVWRDLGDSFWHHQETACAWLCYESAERIAPEHPALDEPRRLGRQLMGAYPEYFQAVPQRPH